MSFAKRRTALVAGLGAPVGFSVLICAFCLRQQDSPLVILPVVVLLLLNAGLGVLVWLQYRTTVTMNGVEHPVKGVLGWSSVTRIESKPNEVWIIGDGKKVVLVLSHFVEPGAVLAFVAAQLRGAGRGALLDAPGRADE